MMLTKLENMEKLNATTGKDFSGLTNSSDSEAIYIYPSYAQRVLYIAFPNSPTFESSRTRLSQTDAVCY